MKFIDKAKIMLESRQFCDSGNNFLKKIIGAATGDIVAAAEAFSCILSSPMFIRECLFWEKYSMFLNDVFLEDDDKRKLSEVFAVNEEKEDYARRIIKIIDDIDTNVKVRYISNLTRALLVKFISKSDYYRLCHAIRNTMEEDLHHLSQNIKKDHLKNNIHIEFLRQNGLTMQTVNSGGNFDTNEDDGEFEFTPLAHMLDKFGLDYENEQKYKYSNSIKTLSEQSIPVTNVGKVIAKFG